MEEDDNDSEMSSANMVFVDVVLTTVMLFAIYAVVIHDFMFTHLANR